MEVIKGTNAWSIADKEAGNDGVKRVFFQVSSKSGVGSNFKCGRNKDEIIKNTDLEVIKDETNKHEGSTSNKPSLSSEDWIYYDKRIIQLSDGINVFVIESYFEKTNIVGEITTIRNGKTDDPAFDNSKGTTLSFEDAVIGKRINMGDMYTDFEHEVYNNSSVGSCNHSGYTISCYQSEHLSNDMFTYYLDDNQKVVNMTATLMSYYP